MKKNNDLINVVLTSTFIGLGILLPYITFGNPQVGIMLLPMHIPILLCGFICGFKYGFIAGFVTPILRSMLVGMPMLFPMAITMSFELAAYGAAAGLGFILFNKLMSEKNRMIVLYVSLVVSLLVGRIVWALVASSTYQAAGWPFNFDVFVSAAFLEVWPGILIQLLIIPAIVFGLMRNPNIEEHVLSN